MSLMFAPCKTSRPIQWITRLISQTLIHWIEIYPVDSTIQRLNNQSLDSRIWEIFASGIQKAEDFCFRNLEFWA